MPASCFDNREVMQYAMSPYMHIDTWFSLFQIDKLPDEVRRELQSRQGTESFVLSYFFKFWIYTCRRQSELGIRVDVERAKQFVFR